jgi:hypothetical protein
MPAPCAVSAATSTLSATGPEGVAVGLALPVTARAETALALSMLDSAWTVAEGLSVPVAMGGRRGAVHRELRDRPGRRLSLGAGQRGSNEAPMQADLGMRRRRLIPRGFGFGRLLRFDRGAGRSCRGGGAFRFHGRWFAFDGRERDPLARRGERRRPGDGLLPAARRQLPAAVLVLGVARRAPDLADIFADERHNRVVAQPPLTRTVVIDKITNSKLARMHAQSLENAWWDEDGAGRPILTKPRNGGQRPPATAIRGPRCQRPAGNEKRRSSAS